VDHEHDVPERVAEHARQRINVVVVVKTALPRALAHAKTRGWRHRRFVSSCPSAPGSAPR
jgi:post-segregation antitoxin (ccd killing protein)